MPTLLNPLSLASRLKRTGAISSAALAVSLSLSGGLVTAEEAQKTQQTLPVEQTVSAEFPYEKKFMEINGSSMAYVDQGQGQPVVFLHGNPTSSYLWRNIMPYMEDTHRVIAPDLIGMGDSDKPDIDYSYEQQAEYLHALLDKLDLKDAIFVIHDWGSALGLHYMRNNTDRVAGVVFMESTVSPSFPFDSYEVMGPDGDFIKALKTKGVGEQLVLEKNVFIEGFLAKQGVVTPVSADAMEVYRAPYPTAESRKPLLVWPREIPIAGQPADVAAQVKKNNEWFIESDLPKLFFYVSPGAITSVKDAKWIAENYQNIESRFLGKGFHYVQEDYPHQIGAGIEDWLRRNQL